jgi:hypothetical protein
MNMLRHMRTSVDIPDPLLRRARSLARQRGITLRQLRIDGLRAALDHETSPSEHRMEDRSYGEGGLVGGLSWSDVERLDELTYGDRG